MYNGISPFTFPLKPSIRQSDRSHSSLPTKRKRNERNVSGIDQKYHDDSVSEPFVDAVAGSGTAQSLHPPEVPPKVLHEASARVSLHLESEAGDDSRVADSALDLQRRRHDNPSPFYRKPAAEGLRQRHLAVLTTVLHVSLLNRDFERAGRAWAILLRCESNGHPMNIRQQNQWGIGSEILLRHGSLEPKQTQHLASEQEQDLQDSSLAFAQAALAKSKAYYERLVVQYPYRKATPNATSAYQFYVIMFSFWIYSLPNMDTSRIGGAMNVYSAIERDASGILARLDELLLSPPHSDNFRLWDLQGKLALWMTHVLSIAASPLEDGGNKEAGIFDRTKRTTERRELMNKARAAFQRVAELGGCSDAVLEEGLDLETGASSTQSMRISDAVSSE